MPGLTQGERILDAVDIAGRAQATLAVSGTAAQTAAALAQGAYDVWCDGADVYIKVAETANDVTTSTGYVIKAGNVVPVWVPANNKLGAITAGAAATLCYHRVG